jgi:ABC-type molybdenum transport system ATPase subunit/photorepair protein PhrA
MVAPRWRLGHEPTTARGRLEVQTAMSDNVIEVQNLTKRYGQTTVVKGISFSVRPGNFRATWSQRFWQNHHHLDAAWID